MAAHLSKKRLILLLYRYLNSGVKFVFLNVGFDLTSFERTLKIISRINRWIDHNKEDFKLATTVNEIVDSNDSRLYIAYDLQKMSSPEQHLEIEQLLSVRGYLENDINKVLGGNFIRIAYSNWK